MKQAWAQLALLQLIFIKNLRIMRNKIFPITALSIPKNILGIESKGLGDRRIVVNNVKKSI